jgi:tRNA(Ile)-lysidine synthase
VVLKKKTWSKEHHDLYQKLKKYKLTSEKFMLMVSGGSDSIAALKIWSEVVSDRTLYSVFHYHHGDEQNQEYRCAARALVQDLCQNLGVAYFEGKNTKKAFVSEGEFRKARYDAARRIRREKGFSYLVTAHHADDLFETRLIRLIRGSGVKGFQSIFTLSGDLFRPWLEISKQQLCRHLLEGKNSFWKHIEDPTNRQAKHTLRNWLRNDWIPRLNQIRPGGSQRMASSFDLIAKHLHSHELSDESFDQIVDLDSKKMNLQKFSLLEINTQKNIIARIYQRLSQKNFSTSGILEVMKQLDKTKEGYTFKVQGLTWLIAGQYVIIECIMTES